LVEQTIKQGVADSTAMRVHAVQQSVGPRKPGQQQTATGLHPRKAAGLNRICSVRRRIPAAIATRGVVEIRAPGPHKARSPITVVLQQGLAPTPGTRIAMIARHRQAQEITVRDIL